MMPAKKTTDNQNESNDPEGAKAGAADGAKKSSSSSRGSRAKATAGDAVQSAAKVARKAVKKVASAIGDAVTELADKNARRKTAASAKAAAGAESVAKAGSMKKTVTKANAVVADVAGTAPKAARTKKKDAQAMTPDTSSADVQSIIDNSVTSGAGNDLSAYPTEVRRHFIDEQAHNVAPPPAEHRELPDTYGDTKLVVLVRDPEWVYAYWEISDGSKQKLGIADNGHGRRMVLRFYKVSGRNWPEDAAEYFFDVDVSPYAFNWYIKLPEVNEQWVSELGFFDDASSFVTVCRSNPVVTPRNTISEVIDSEWMTVEESFQKITKLAGGDMLQAHLSGANGSLPGSESILRQLNRHIAGIMLGERAALSSGIFSSGQLAGRGPDAGKQFWLQAHTELILYGATEPDARVTVQGQPVQLAADGTFSMRFALPDGEQVLTVKAVSADGDFEESITPVVTRTTR